jgi:hypothetical protein
MKAYSIAFFFFLFFVNITIAQTDHYETVVRDTQQWKYIVPTASSSANWKQPSFDASAWQTNKGGFGFGDNDDGTIIPNGSVSVYMRKSFNITDINALTKIIFHMDYDDGFIAYINGFEIARNNLGTIGQPAAFNLFASASHEAQLYQNGVPDQFIFNPAQFASFLVQGINVLCVEVHNQTATGSDLSARPFLTLGINNTTNDYGVTPTWFVAPFEFITSTLPIVVISTNNIAIPDAPKIDGFMGIIDNGPGQLNNINNPYNEFYGQIAIETRGSSSSMFPAKSYGLETRGPDSVNYNVSVFDWPSDNDWVLYAPYTDKSLIRNVLTFKLGNETGNYAPRTKLCELILNDEYVGVYVFMERIKINPGRVGVDPLEYIDTVDNHITGGYIVKVDKTTGGGIIAWTSPFASAVPGNSAINYQLHDPSIEVIHPLQKQYIQSYVSAWETALAGPNFYDPQIGFRAYADEASFIDFMLINELSKNVDGYRISTFLYKERFSEGGKLVAGPLWDFNLGWGNANYCQGGNTSGWEINFNAICGGGLDNPFWWNRMLQDPVYANRVKCRWLELRTSVLDSSVLMNYIDSMSLALTLPAQRTYTKWPILGTYVWPNNFIGQTYIEEMEYLKSWTSSRLVWMDNNMFGTCSSLGTQPLVEDPIRIFPNPAAESLFIDGLNQKTNIIVRDCQGKIVIETTADVYSYLLNISHLVSGIYFISIPQINQKNYKILVQK